jgi:hypothetical protein
MPPRIQAHLPQFMLFSGGRKRRKEGVGISTDSLPEKQTDTGQVATLRVRRRCRGECSVYLQAESTQPLLHLGVCDVTSTQHDSYLFTGNSLLMLQQRCHSGCSSGFYHDTGQGEQEFHGTDDRIV